jgi:hypothetical protein
LRFPGQEIGVRFRHVMPSHDESCPRMNISETRPDCNPELIPATFRF